ncbi:unnamed protein product [Rhodiola kirilowii]
MELMVENEKQSLVCPRCESGNTKFCYYNNYNKSQPRHYCRSCKRHWTEGGTLRNLPTGVNKRSNTKTKSKNYKKTVPKGKRSGKTRAANHHGIVVSVSSDEIVDQKTDAQMVVQKKDDNFGGIIGPSEYCFDALPAEMFGFELLPEASDLVSIVENNGAEDEQQWQWKWQVPNTDDSVWMDMRWEDDDNSMFCDSDFLTMDVPELM